MMLGKSERCCMGVLLCVGVCGVVTREAKCVWSMISFA